MPKVSGSLQHVIKRSRVAWYCGDDGTRAYIEVPHAQIPGLVAVNGKKIMNLRDDGVNTLSPDVLSKIAAYGVLCDSGWSCQHELHGMEINKAFAESNCRAVKHHNGWIKVLLVDNQTCSIFVNGEKWCTCAISGTHNILAEWGVTTRDGWIPVVQQLSSPRSFF